MPQKEIDYLDKNLFPQSATISINNKKYSIDMLLCFYVFDCEAKADGKDIVGLVQMFEEFMGNENVRYR